MHLARFLNGGNPLLSVQNLFTGSYRFTWADTVTLLEPNTTESSILLWSPSEISWIYVNSPASGGPTVFDFAEQDADTDCTLAIILPNAQTVSTASGFQTGQVVPIT